MAKEMFLLLFIGHFLADYYFQTDKAIQKQNTKTVLKHSLIYAATLVVITLPVFNRSLFILTLIVSLCHG